MGGLRGPLAVALWVLAVAGCGHADKEQVTISFARSDRVSDFLGEVSRLIGRPIFHDPSNPLLQATMGCNLRHDVPRRELFDVTRALLAFFEVRLLPVGRDFLVAVDALSSGSVKYPQLVPCEQLARYAGRDDLRLVTFVPVRHVDRLNVPPGTMFTPTSRRRSRCPFGAGARDPAALVVVAGRAPEVVARARAIREADGG